ncbi:MAG: pyruvate:ferredoxin (flavodoxin) oxidoreductase [Kiritimatiellaeota bacterium]|nr:pyruvate:ferredoxin (flavodoxin) oxidoreductase [Kiritimatiellota bacterium]
MSNKKIMIDGNEAAAKIAFKVSEICAIYPITPSSPMAEWCDEWAARKSANIWGTVPQVVEMESEGGAAGAVHGALTTGALTTTFTASQGLLLMIPNMYKIAGELTPTVFHVSARSLAYQGLSIFGDHSDVLSCRQTGFAMLAAASVQEVMDMALTSHAATLESRIPFIHFFDGFRTSHEVQKVDDIADDVLRAMIDDDLVIAHRKRGLTPDAPKIRGTAQNPDVYFQGRETSNPFYNAVPGIVQGAFDKLAKHTGRQYKLFDYVGAPDAENVIVAMGSGTDTIDETVAKLVAEGKKVGLVKVRLYRPFAVEAFAKALPATVKTITVLDRVKEPGSLGDPLYLDVRTALAEAAEAGWLKCAAPKVLAGRYGLGSKEFTPAMVKGVFKNACGCCTKTAPKNHFTVGIIDDVTNTSIDFDPAFVIDHPGRTECLFFGLGSDGTVGANKNSIKIIGDETDNSAQAYFVYDSKKAGVLTVSHLRFGKGAIQSPYLCTNASFIACHNFSFVEKYDMLSNAKEGAVFLLTSPYAADEVWNHLPDEIEAQIIAKKLRFFVIDAGKIAHETGMGGRINTVMQTAFFKISGIIAEAEAIALLKKYAQKAYGRKGEAVVKKNWDAIDAASDAVREVKYPAAPAGKLRKRLPVSAEAPEFVQKVSAEIISQRGDALPVSAIPNDGTWPVATTQWEKRNIATEIPVWDPAACIQCLTCSLVCPHAAIRGKICEPADFANAPATFKTADAKTPAFAGKKFALQCAPEDCTGCGACVHACPVKAKGAIKMADQIPLRAAEADNFKFFLSLPEYDRAKIDTGTVKGSQLCQPLFEFSGACAGCGETPYVKLLTQLFGDRAIIANATGCSSIYGGNLPTTPYCTRNDGRGPAWANSLFEDNAQFGLGMRMTFDKFNAYALELCKGGIENGSQPIKEICAEIIAAEQKTSDQIEAQRARVAKLKALLKDFPDCPFCKQLASIADYLVRKSVWILGGDGWAYDIGYGGLDHVLATGRNVKVLVLDTEVYSNTGGQASKSTPLGAIAKFAFGGKPQQKKDLGMISMTYGNIYVAQIAYGSNTAQTVKAFTEAEAYDGPALIIAYSHCISHGIDMTTGIDNQKLAVDTGHFPLYRFNPDNTAQGKNPLSLDSKPPTKNFADQAAVENRFTQLKQMSPEDSAKYVAEAEKRFKTKYALLQQLAALQG